MPADKAAVIIRYALEQGVTFIDTAQRYQTYDHVRGALKGYAGPVVIASKSWATSYDDMKQAVEEARIGLGRDTVDIFHLHAARADATVFVQRQGALEYLCEAKARGVIRAAGISTHSVKAVRAAADTPQIDVIHPLVNMRGLGILDGTLDDMLAAVKYAAEQGKGIYLMKAMAGGHLADRFEAALDFARAIPGVGAIAVGMLSKPEVDANIAHLTGRPIGEALRAQISKRLKKIHILDQCKGCGSCEQNCPNGAMKVVNKMAQADPEKCVLCGYCVPFCPQFSIRLINQ
jgi:predicted aldo/keto reductase-like oxidoreductase